MAVLTIIADVLAGRSLAAYCLSSATGEASRRITVSCPCEASRAIALLVRAKPSGLLLVLADMRSIAASGILNLRVRTICP